jgi:hypothetical protein
MKKTLVLISLWLMVVSSQAVVAFNSFGPGDASKTFGWGFGDVKDTRIASQFTAMVSGTLTSLDLKLLGSGTPGTVRVSLFEDAGNDTGSLMTVLTTRASSAGIKVVTNSDPNIRLVAGRKYWIEMKSDAGSGVYSGWYINNQNIRGSIKFGAVGQGSYKVGSNSEIPAFRVNVSVPAEISYKRTATVNLDGTPVIMSLPRFNPVLGTLTEVRVRTFVRANAMLGVENTSDTPGSGRGGFSGGANLEAEVPGLGSYYLAHAGFVGKGREKRLTAFDGVVDYRGTSGGTDAFPTSQGAVASVTDPIALTLLSGTGNVSLSAYMSSQLLWQWYNGRTEEWPEMSLTGNGSIGVVITYVYTQI